MKNAVQNLILAVLVVVLLMFAASTVECQTLDDLQSMRWSSMSLVNVAVAGTPQITTAFVDSAIGWAEQTVGTDFALSSYMTNTDTQTVTASVPANDTMPFIHIYALNSDFIPGGLVSASRKPYDLGKGGRSFYPITVGKPPPSTAKPSDDEMNTPAYAWTEGNLLFVHPAPRAADKFLLAYRALPDKMTEDTSDTDVDPPLRRMVVVLAAADIAKRLNLTGREAMLRSEYAAFKSERLVLPAAALSGGDQ